MTNWKKKLLIELGFKHVFDKPTILKMVDNKVSLSIQPTIHNQANCLIIELDNVKVMFSHIPIKSDAFRYQEDSKYLSELFIQEKCHVNIHGHVHSSDTNDKRCVNVSVESIEFTPLNVTEILKHFK